MSLLQKHLFTYVEFTAFFNNIDSFAQEYVRNKGNSQWFQQKIDFYPTYKNKGLLLKKLNFKPLYWLRGMFLTNFGFYRTIEEINIIMR